MVSCSKTQEISLDQITGAGFLPPWLQGVRLDPEIPSSASSQRWRWVDTSQVLEPPQAWVRVSSAYAAQWLCGFGQGNTPLCAIPVEDQE